MLFLGHFVVVNWSEQLGVMQVMELLFSFHLLGLCMCVCVKINTGQLDMGKRHNRSKYSQMMVRMKETSQSELPDTFTFSHQCRQEHFYHI